MHSFDRLKLALVGFTKMSKGTQVTRETLIPPSGEKAIKAERQRVRDAEPKAKAKFIVDVQGQNVKGRGPQETEYTG
tara:strand:- start:142 stop:372 length:231 start_codon:yes stop_codon:yes gene_type:complete